MSHERAELLESFLLIFSGIFIAYVVLSLHSRITTHHSDIMNRHVEHVRVDAFDYLLFFTVFFMVFREGFEIALFTASALLFSGFLVNVVGLFVGFLCAAVVGVGVQAMYVRFPIRRVFKVTEYGIVLLGASLVQHGTTELFVQVWQIELGSIVPISLWFLPEYASWGGHLLQTLLGVDREFSLMRLWIMLVYAWIVVRFVIQKQRRVGV